MYIKIMGEKLLFSEEETVGSVYVDDKIDNRDRYMLLNGRIEKREVVLMSMGMLNGKTFVRLIKDQPVIVNVSVSIGEKKETVRVLTEYTDDKKAQMLLIDPRIKCRVDIAMPDERECIVGSAVSDFYGVEEEDAHGVVRVEGHTVVIEKHPYLSMIESLREEMEDIKERIK